MATRTFDFGDGETVDAEPPVSHTYTEEGTYTVSATNAGTVEVTVPTFAQAWTSVLTSSVDGTMAYFDIGVYPGQLVPWDVAPPSSVSMGEMGALMPDMWIAGGGAFPAATSATWGSDLDGRELVVGPSDSPTLDAWLTPTVTGWHFGAIALTVALTDADDNLVASGESDGLVLRPHIHAVSPSSGTADESVPVLITGMFDPDDVEITLDGTPVSVTVDRPGSATEMPRLAATFEAGAEGTRVVAMRSKGVDAAFTRDFPVAAAAPEAFDPDDYTVAEVIAYVEANPEETQAVYDAESAGKARVTLLTDLESRLA